MAADVVWAQQPRFGLPRRHFFEAHGGKRRKMLPPCSLAWHFGLSSAVGRSPRWFESAKLRW